MDNAPSIVRILDAEGAVAGTGFLVTSELALTCAHVLGEQDSITLDFPLLDGDSTVSARVVAAVAEADIAVLRLDVTPPGAVPSRLSREPVRWGEQVRVFGFPPELEHGVWVAAELRAATAAGWVQIESAPGRRRVGPGFSGSPVYSPAAGGVVGMVVAAERGAGTTTAYVLPVAALLAADPGIAAPDPAEVCPYRGLEPFGEEHADGFRGRAELTGQVLDVVAAQPVVVVAGPSGSGKSSLVRAGVVPGVRRRGMDVVLFRVLAGDPLTAFALALLGPDAGLAAAEELGKRLDSPEKALPWLLERAGPGGLLIGIDQFEEIPPEQARELFAALFNLVSAAPRQRDGSPTLVLVLTLRSGTLDELVTSQSADAVRDGVVFVPPMTRAQLAEAVRADGVSFENGLVDRILHDAGTEPGTLPLVEFTLARLWEQREAGQLTNRAYGELDGVAGALAGYAEGLYGRLSPEEQQAARRLLTGLARPDDSGFQRRQMPLSDVDYELLPVLGKLSTGRLVVVDGQAKIVELAHQALLHRWPRLKGWLAEEREFLSWRQQLRDSLTRWQLDGREEDGLLRGLALARAEQWQPKLTADEREYVGASRIRAQRRRRRRRVLVGVITALALVASGLAVTTYWANLETQEQLQTAQSRALAAESDALQSSDPRSALQLAQTAWHLAPTTEAWGALFKQYVRYQEVDKLFQGLWPGKLRQVLSSTDGGTTVLVNEEGQPSWWTGLNGDHPVQARALDRPPTDGMFQLSPSGKALAFTSADGTVLLWRRDSPDVVMLRAKLPVPPGVGVRSVSFSPDEDRLLISRTGKPAALELWDLPQRKQLPIPDTLNPIGYVAYLGTAPNTMVYQADGATSFDLNTGRALRQSHVANSLGLIGENGAALVECADDTKLRVREIATGALRGEFPVPSCFDLTLKLDSTTNYALFPGNAETDESHQGLGVANLRTGAYHRLTIPALSLSNDIEVMERLLHKVSVFPGADGRPTVLFGARNLLYRQPGQDPAPPVPSVNTVRSHDGEFAVSYDLSGRVFLRARTGTVLSSTAGSAKRDFAIQGNSIEFTADNKRLLTIEDNTLVIYSVPTLAVERRIELPKPPDSTRLLPWESSLRDLGNGQVVVLHADKLSRWVLADGKQVGEPISPQPHRTEPPHANSGAMLAAQPGNPAEVAVIQRSGDVELWHLDQRKRIGILGQTSARSEMVHFTADPPGVLVLTADNTIRSWELNPLRERGRPIAVGSSVRLLGPAPGGKVITAGGGIHGHTAKLWDVATAKLMGTFTSDRDSDPWLLTGDELIDLTAAGRRSVRLEPELWRTVLCAHNNRDFTEPERAMLTHLNVPAERPCTAP
ncbi:MULTISPECIES: trypsin-like peptidase domain-containing protein [unclassified Crossiella]|uniref:nSTAND1 domain-containing NTPase n=1 Tax=unclassified Crossiella TaxID=2620835 RepID=UPI001FFEACAE|nr:MULTISPECIES: trypsin-like peptidase domain-containing protein [unclassified Crossiella]MCK2241712.1 trypsin-like peptidase domain-containing protein [Crossiella sp. S99.2]MCK2255416.1 trypsin-like peptidase domain-containing protein [Crossiella sp. S99.1]